MDEAIVHQRQGPWHDAGALLSWAAVVFAVVAQLAGAPWSTIAGLALFMAGLSHGAGDENEGRIAAHAPIHILAYLVVGAATAALFLAAPAAGLALFLALSAWHFAHSDIAMHRLARVAIAGLAIGGSALFRQDATGEVFAVIIGYEPPALALDLLAIAGLGGAAAAVVGFVKGVRGSGHGIVAMLACLALDPVLAVGLIFLVAHAIPVQQRQVAAYGSRAVWRAVAWPTAIAAVGGAGLAIAIYLGALAMPVALALAFGMATPHMLTERLER